jgi:DNA-binding NarL/FixJ family response regulator
METLLVEDNLIFRQTIKQILLSEFPTMRIREASNGTDAFQSMDSQASELILMDIQLPGDNGLLLTRKLKDAFPHVVVILTEHDVPEYRDAAYRCGADHFLVKGSTRAIEILNLVRSICSREAPAV